MNGHATYHLHGTVTQGVSVSGAPSTGTGSATVDVWIRQDDFYVAKETASFQSSSGTTTSSGSFTLNVTAWDAEVIITIPTNVLGG